MQISIDRQSPVPIREQIYLEIDGELEERSDR